MSQFWSFFSQTYKIGLNVAKVPSGNGSSNVAILSYFIALVARVAEVDGQTNDQELRCLYSFFSNFLNVKQKILSLYRDACSEELDIGFLTLKIRNNSPKNIVLYKEICIKLIEIADSDGPINQAEFNLISQIAIDFSFSREDVENSIKQYILKSGSSDYEILNLSESASVKEINDSYRELAMKFHPDKLFAYENTNPVCLDAYKKRYEIVSQAYKNLKSKSLATIGANSSQ